MCHRVTLSRIRRGPFFRPSWTQKAVQKCGVPSRHTGCSDLLHANPPSSPHSLVLFASWVLPRRWGARPSARTTKRSSVHKVNGITTSISYAPNSTYCHRQCLPELDRRRAREAAQFESGPGNPKGVSYRWASCTARASIVAPGSTRRSGPAARPKRTPAGAGAPQQIDTPYFFATYTNGIHNDINAGDGFAHAHALCRCRVQRSKRVWERKRPTRGRFRPRPTTRSARFPMGARSSGATCRATGTGCSCATRRRPGPPPSQNWYFVHRGCTVHALGTRSEVNAALYCSQLAPRPARWGSMAGRAYADRLHDGIRRSCVPPARG